MIDRCDIATCAVRFVVGADVCGALGCRETSGLLKVERGHETRVLCPDHARRWVSA
jgi:predicted ThiF/HesA family dinucleotide-utilizing enzyme